MRFGTLSKKLHFLGRTLFSEIGTKLLRHCQLDPANRSSGSVDLPNCSSKLSNLCVRGLWGCSGRVLVEWLGKCLFGFGGAVGVAESAFRSAQRAKIMCPNVWFKAVKMMVRNHAPPIPSFSVASHKSSCIWALKSSLTNCGFGEADFLFGADSFLVTCIFVFEHLYIRF